MKPQIKNLFFISAALVTLLSSASAADRWVTQNAHISFFSSTPAEDIEANNYSVVVVLDSKEDSLGFSVPMQAFEFKKSAMQKHFNQKNFLNTKEFPQATFKGKIEDADSIDYATNGEYEVTITGTMTIHGVEREVTQKGTLEISNDTVSLYSVFDLTLADYEVIFNSGKPSKNIAKTIKVTVKAKNIKPTAAVGA